MTFLKTLRLTKVDEGFPMLYVKCFFDSNTFRTNETNAKQTHAKLMKFL